MLFVVDIGNTNIVLGLYENDTLLHCWRVGTDDKKTTDEYEVLLRNFFQKVNLESRYVDGAIISSVVPMLTGVFYDLCQRVFDVSSLIVGPGLKTGMPIKMDNPREVGADRIANGVAAYALYGGPVIVADFGTATTFDVVSKDGEYIGGVISPGISISMEALFQRAAKLPRVELMQPSSSIGRNTVAGMQAGIMGQVIGGINYTVDSIRRELEFNAPVVATGGLAELVGPHSEAIDIINPILTLEGLKLIYHRNV